MGEFIEVYDTLISSKLSTQFEQDILDNTFPFRYVRNVTYGNLNPSSKYSPSFAADLNVQSDQYPKSNIFYVNQILYNFSFKLGISINQILYTKLLMQIPSINTSPGNIHTDITDSEGNTMPHWVCLYYVEDSDGDTIFYDKNMKELKRVSPKKGRIAFFDGSILHCSSPPTKKHRTIINFNFIGSKL